MPTAPRVIALVVLTLVGCAGPKQQAKEVGRLRSDVNLLGERVSQLERSGLSGDSSTTSAWPDPLLTPSAPAPSASSASKPAASASAKPPKKDIQTALKNAGFYDGALDGKIGPRTREAIKEFQRLHGLKVDGVVGRLTWKQLSPYLDLSGVDLSTIPDTALK
jgi:murein L,D-transpeptidase YcbB/YkuD